MPDYLGLNSLGEEYELVYELDLNELQDTINYSIDRSKDITGFDRIGYLVELESSAYGKQALFVSMDAFTDDIKKDRSATSKHRGIFSTNSRRARIYFYCECA